MTTIQIIDTGYVNTSRNGSIVTRANSGSAITLKVQTIRFSWGGTIDATPEPGSDDTARATVASFDNRGFELIVDFYKDSADDQEAFKDVIGVMGSDDYPGLKKTEGVKAIVCSDYGTDVKKTIVELIGNTSTNFHGAEITSGLPAILCYVENISADDVPDSNKIRVRITCREA